MWELPSPVPPLLVTHKKSHHLYPTHMLYLSHTCTLPLGDPKSVRAKKFERIHEKNTALCHLPNTFDPTKHGVKWMRIECHRGMHKLTVGKLEV